ncbi:hypothetical protein LAZ67_X000796 [Cordylochernes scorpioides]|uniref:Integrase catalytic domain-containing protein n=1 Tax=Cordylochernes scorpioides TaxID=51811 RepID=A0ABY6LV23_9ARAC|nr:hypothetical protein LAZ67_X000796 [Cordylochernes scorpioides]
MDDWGSKLESRLSATELGMQKFDTRVQQLESSLELTASAVEVNFKKDLKIFVNKDYSPSTREQRRLLIPKWKEFLNKGITAKLRDDKLIVNGTVYRVFNGKITTKKDLKKAFDTVPHALPWTKLVKIGLNHRFVNLIKCYYEDMTAAVRWSNSITEFIEIRSGVLQDRWFLFLKYCRGLTPPVPCDDAASSGVDQLPGFPLLFLCRVSKEFREPQLKWISLPLMTTELPQIQKFNGDNFHLWKFQMKIILEAKDLLSITDGSEVKPEIEDIAKFSNWKKKDAKSKMLITTALEFKYLQQIVNCQTSAEMWKKLSTIYELKSETNKYLLQQRFFEYKMNPNDNIATHISKVETLAQQMKDLGEPISDVALITKIICSLPDKYKNFITAWDSVSSEEKTLENLTARLLKEESLQDHWDSSGNSKPDNALMTFSKFNRNSTASNKQQQHQQSIKDKKKNTHCGYCKKKGHWWKECYKRKEEQKGQQPSSSSRDDSCAFSAETSAFYAETKDSWIADSGATDHMTFRREWFSTFEEIPEGVHPVCLGDGKQIYAKGKGNIDILSYVDSQKINATLLDVLYVPELETNLFSISTATKHGLTLICKGNQIKLTKNSKVLVTGIKDNSNLYRIFIKAKQSSQTHVAQLSLDIWHQRMGHVNPIKLTQMLENNVFEEDIKIREKPDSLLCEACIYGKQNRKVFHASTSPNSTYPGELIYSDVCGPMSKRSPGIVHELTAPYTPEQNGIAERDNRTIVESARCLLHGRKMPLELWAEAVNTAVYLLNRCTTKVLGNSTPYEIWYKRKPSILHLKTFGCNAYVHIPKDNRKKLDKKSIRTFFVGYTETNKNYRMWDPIARKIIISRDVIFTEANTSENIQDNQQEHVTIYSEESVDNTNTSSKPEESCRYPLRNRIREKEQTSTSCTRAISYACYVHDQEPLNYEDAIVGQNSKQWKLAMDDEFNSLMKNQTWTYVTLPSDRKAIACKWVYKIKQNADGSNKMFKARLVAKGYSQKPGLDYGETFSPVVKFDSIRTILSLCASLDMEMIQLDVKSAFLNGDLEEELYMEQPQGYENPDFPNHVCSLQKSIYGLKQSPRMWNKKFHEFLIKFDLKPSISDSCVYTMKCKQAYILLAIYVDDCLICSVNKQHLDDIVQYLNSNFEIKTFTADYFLGLQIYRDRTTKMLFLHQASYIERTLEHYNLLDIKLQSVPSDPYSKLTKEMCPKDDQEIEEMNKIPYRQTIGSLMYLMTGTRPDIAYAVSRVSQFMNNPGPSHWTAVKKIFGYLKATKNIGICFGGSSCTSTLIGFSDADFAGDLDTRKSTTGYVFMLNNGPISWCSQKQNCVSLSTTESEYIAASKATKEAIWLRHLLRELHQEQVKPTTIFCDNQSCIRLVHNPEYHKRTKHIDIWYHFIRDHFQNHAIDLLYVCSNDQAADIFTKALPPERSLVSIFKILSRLDPTGSLRRRRFLRRRSNTRVPVALPLQLYPAEHPRSSENHNLNGSPYHWWWDTRDLPEEQGLWRWRKNSNTCLEISADFDFLGSYNIKTSSEMIRPDTALDPTGSLRRRRFLRRRSTTRVPVALPLQLYPAEHPMSSENHNLNGSPYHWWWDTRDLPEEQGLWRWRE